MYQLGPLPQPEGKTGSIREKPPSAVRIEVVIVMCALTGSNRRPAGCKPAALPAELKARTFPTDCQPTCESNEGNPITPSQGSGNQTPVASGHPEIGA